MHVIVTYALTFKIFLEKRRILRFLFSERPIFRSFNVLCVEKRVWFETIFAASIIGNSCRALHDRLLHNIERNDINCRVAIQSIERKRVLKQARRLSHLSVCLSGG